MIQAQKKQSTDSHGLVFVTEENQQTIAERLARYNFGIQQTQIVTKLPTETIEAHIDNHLIYIPSHHIKKAAYILLDLGLPLTHITSAEQPLSPAQSNKLIAAISQKIAEQAVVKGLQPHEEKKQPDSQPPTAAPSRDTQSSSTNTSYHEYLEMAQQAIPDIQSVLATSKNNDTLATRHTNLSETLNHIHHAIEANELSSLEGLLSQAMTSMEKIELHLLEHQQDDATNELADSLQDEIIGVKENKIIPTPKTPPKKTHTKTTIHAKNIIGSILSWLWKVGLVWTLLQAGFMAYQYIVQQYLNTTNLTTLIIVGSATIVMILISYLINKAISH